MRYFWIFLLIGSVAFAEPIITARGQIEVNDGDTLKRNSMWEGQVKNLNDVIFIGWNFARKIPHTKVFVNCANLKFIDCNLVNVELQDDFIVDGSLTIHKRFYSIGDENFEEVECGDNKTRTYRIIDEEIDIVDRDFPEFNAGQKKKLRDKLIEQGLETTERLQQIILIDVKETPDAKKIRAIRNN